MITDAEPKPEQLQDRLENQGEESIKMNRPDEGRMLNLFSSVLVYLLSLRRHSLAC